LLADPRLRVLVAVAVDGVRASMGGGFDERPAEIARSLFAEWSAWVAFTWVLDAWAEAAVAASLRREANRSMSPSSAAIAEASTQLIPGTVSNNGT
jgi:hypothetical protein